MTPYKSIGGACLCLMALGKPCSCSYRPGPAFITNRFSLKIRSFDPRKELPMVFDEASFEAEDAAALFEAEDAAAVDAHDISDPGFEGAAMERAVIMASEYEDQHPHKEIHPTNEVEIEPSKTSFLGKIRSLFRTDNSEDNESEADLIEVSEAEANYAHDLSDTAAMEHANEIMLDESTNKVKGKKGRVFEAMDAEATYAHDLSDTAAMEHADEILIDESTNKDKRTKGRVLEAMEAEAAYAYELSHTADLENILNREEDNDVVDAKKRDATYTHDLATHVHDLSTAAAIDALPNTHDEADIAAVEEHYNSIKDDITRIEHLIEEADRADRAEGHSLERIFSDDDAADLALMMMEKSVVAATDKLELCQKKAEQTEDEVKSALEEKYSAKALAESIERDRSAVETRFLSTEHFSEDEEVMERRRDSSVLRADRELLVDVHKQEHDAELKLEAAIEHDIAAKRELEQMIDNKAVLKQELHELEAIIHERTHELWKKENAKKRAKSEEDNKAHHFDWWHKRW